jgi:hypothetical protein
MSVPNVCATCRKPLPDDTRSVCLTCFPAEADTRTPLQKQKALCREWEARLGIALADACKVLPTDDYVRLCDWMIDVCNAELQMLKSEDV